MNWKEANKGEQMSNEDIVADIKNKLSPFWTCITLSEWFFDESKTYSSRMQIKEELLKALKVAESNKSYIVQQLDKLT